MRMYDRNEVEDISDNSWERAAYEDFKKMVTNKHNAFPCTLGVAGYLANHLRFGFIADKIDSIESSRKVAAMLQSFIPCARTFGKNTSLVIFFSETRDLGIAKYEEIFWQILNASAALDAKAWPKYIPVEPDDSLWEFSFAGEPAFVVCNTPSHQLRRSRYAKNFMITFQPRWVFDGVVGDDAPNAEKIKTEIRRRLTLFDGVPLSPDLGVYGDGDSREWKQYFLRETNAPRSQQCPFHQSIRNVRPEILNTDIKNLEAIVAELLPPTGSVEVQYDSPFRSHELHHHAVDETLHVIRGEITFQYGEHSATCRSGDRLLLPAMTPHKSKAGKDGCLYAIATRLVKPISMNEGCRHEQR
jgi:FPC/CPF motif-containing protein YcgG